MRMHVAALFGRIGPAMRSVKWRPESVECASQIPRASTPASATVPFAPAVTPTSCGYDSFALTEAGADQVLPPSTLELNTVVSRAGASCRDQAT